MTEKAFKQMMSGLKEAKDEYGRTVFPDCRSKYYAVRDAIELLKEQEPVEPILKREGRNKYYNYYVCPRCDEEVVFDQNYCSECGAKFMWEGQ